MGEDMKKHLMLLIGLLVLSISPLAAQTDDQKRHEVLFGRVSAPRRLSQSEPDSASETGFQPVLANQLLQIEILFHDTMSIIGPKTAP